MTQTAIETAGLGKRFRLGVGTGSYDTLREALARAVRRRATRGEELWALRDIDLSVPQGEALGLIGHNGAGKTTLLRILAGIALPSEGYARTYGSVGSLLDVGTGFHPELTGRENIFLSGAVLGMRRQEIRRQFDAIAEFSGVERFLDTPVKRYSEGMRLRLAFAVAAHLEPPIIVVDEVLAVGDAEFREKCMGKMAELGRRDRTVLFVSHDLGAITSLCTRAVWLDRGRMKLDGPARDVVSTYLRSVHTGDTLDAEFDANDSSPVVIRRVTVRNPRSNEILTLPHRGDPLAVELTVEVRQRIPDVNISLLLIDEAGLVIVDDSARDRPHATPTALDGNEGQYVVSAAINSPLLKAGHYTVRVWIGNDVDEYVDREVLTFRVIPRPDDPQVFMERTRVVQPDIEWSARREPVL